MKAFFIIQTGPDENQASILNDVQSQIDHLLFDLPPQQPTQYLTQTQVAQLFNVDIKSIRNWTRKNKLKAYKYGYRIFFKRHELINVFTH